MNQSAWSERRFLRGPCFPARRTGSTQSGDRRRGVRGSDEGGFRRCSERRISGGGTRVRGACAQALFGRGMDRGSCWFSGYASRHRILGKADFVSSRFREAIRCTENRNLTTSLNLLEIPNQEDAEHRRLDSHYLTTRQSGPSALAEARERGHEKNRDASSAADDHRSARNRCRRPLAPKGLEFIVITPVP